MIKEKFVTVITKKQSYKDMYIVSNLGRVVSIKNKKFPKLLRGSSDGRRGYLKIKLYNQLGEAETVYIHRIVLYSFSISKGIDVGVEMTVDHINGIRTDNRLENLQWLSSLDNTLRRDYKWTNREPIFLHKDDVLKSYFVENLTMREISSKFNIDTQTISEFLNGKKYRIDDSISYAEKWCIDNNIEYKIRLNNDLNKFGTKKRIMVIL